MNKGKLTYTGVIDLTQFWPENIKSGNRADSDADTVKVKVDKSSGIFTTPAGKTQKANFINDAGFFHNQNKADGTKVLKFKSVIDANGNIDIRLQGIDAPELHYMTQVHGNPLYRQLCGETCTVQLFNFLKSHTTNNSISCEVFTQVNTPNDVFDKYGRFVGDILIKEKNGGNINVNQWLIENGWAFPAYYNSMTELEIKDLNHLADKAVKGHLGIWPFFSKKMSALDRKLIHDKKDPTYSPAADKKSPIIFPKLFRRLWTFEIQNQTSFTAAGYQKFLASNKTDVCCKTADFLTSGFPKKPPLLASFSSVSGNINFDPAGIVFKEAATSLKNSKGKPLNRSRDFSQG
jgi:endonuclease YncB( thermonuclease family)